MRTGTPQALTVTQLAEIGRALHGSQWQSALARDLGVKARTVRRYVAGETPLPARHASKLLAALRAKAEEIERIANRLSAGESDHVA